MTRKRKYTIGDLLTIMRKLRGPKGCPWDRKQTHASICPALIEEAHEFVDAVRSRSDGKMTEELGDLLLHVVFQAEMGRARKAFDFGDVTDSICRKLIRRHPHVFGSVRVRDAAEVLRNWDAIKAVEKGSERRSVMDRIPRSLPGFPRAEHILKAAYKAGFRWEKQDHLSAKVREELSELFEHLRKRGPARRRGLEEEMGDLFFVLTNLSLDLGLDPERCVRKAGDKFVRRFGRVERAIRTSGRPMTGTPHAELRKLWKKAKGTARVS
jgi:tetrapyrrole methylase family protein/MazG family protein